jgi:hypothetical protein
MSQLPPSRPNVQRERLCQLPVEARPRETCQVLATGRDGKPVTVIIQADGWVLADPRDSPISLDGIAYRRN